MDLFLSFVFLTNYHLCMLYLCAWLMDFLDFFRLVNRFMLFLTIEGLDVGFFFYLYDKFFQKFDRGLLESLAKVNV
jgi:hypothetical protein